MNPAETTDAIDNGADPADVGNRTIAEAVIERCQQIQQLAADCDRDLALYLDPDHEGWNGFTDDTPTVMVQAYLALKEAAGELSLVVKRSEELACDALGRDQVILADRMVRVRSSKRRTFPPEKKSELRDLMVSRVARAVAVDRVTGEFDDDASKTAQRTLEVFDRWQTIDPAKFKATHLRNEGVDLDEYSEGETVLRIEERPL